MTNRYNIRITETATHGRVFSMELQDGGPWVAFEDFEALADWIIDEGGDPEKIIERARAWREQYGG